MTLVSAVAVALLAYLAGSVPFGYLLSRLAGLGDIRAIGSGNIGATNVLRTGRRGLAAATLLLDGGKGAAVTLYIWSMTGDRGLTAIAGLFAVVGHCFSIWMRGRGGKGAATGLGVILAWSWPAGIGCCAVWLATALAFRRSSLATIAAFVAAPLLTLAWPGMSNPLFALLASLLVIWRHDGNIRRLLAGTEPKIGAGR